MKRNIDVWERLMRTMPDSNLRETAFALITDWRIDLGLKLGGPPVAWLTRWKTETEHQDPRPSWAMGLGIRSSRSCRSASDWSIFVPSSTVWRCQGDILELTQTSQGRVFLSCWNKLVQDESTEGLRMMATNKEREEEKFMENKISLKNLKDIKKPDPDFPFLFDWFHID